MTPLLVALAAAEPIVGVALRPLSRADLLIVASDGDSGVGVGEEDGVVRPSLDAFAGAWAGRFGVVGSLGVAAVATVSRSGDALRRETIGVVRPSVAGRWSITPRDATGPHVFPFLALHGDVPWASDRSDAFNDDEADAAQDGARETRFRLAGGGGSAGFGVEIDVGAHARIGGTWEVRLHRGGARSSTAASVTTTTRSDVALLATFHW